MINNPKYIEEILLKSNRGFIKDRGERSSSPKGKLKCFEVLAQNVALVVLFYQFHLFGHPQLPPKSFW